MRHTAVLLPALLLAAPLAAQETRFTRDMNSGHRLELMNINGAIIVTQGTGRTLAVTVTKEVKRGTGDKVKAIMEEENGVVRICTLDQQRYPSKTTCRGSQESSGRTSGRDDEVDMEYVVTLPAGVTLSATTVNGAIKATGVRRATSLTTVNGSVDFSGETVEELTSVNGSIDATLASTGWKGTLALQTVNGSVTVRLPADADLTVKGSTVSGAINSDFPRITGKGRYGPRSLEGTLGRGGRALDIQTVSGSVSVVKK